MRHEHDAVDLALARAAIAQDKPVLAICRGHQVLNVALGGTLHQHLPDVIGKRAAAGHYHNHNDIDVVAGSKTAAAMGTTRPRGHCVHHQAIDRLGAGLVVTAWSDDVIEGVELPDRWVVGVQWHPEDTAASDPAQQATVRRLRRRGTPTRRQSVIDGRCRRVRARHRRSHDPVVVDVCGSPSASSG